MSPPDISVLMATHDRPEMLRLGIGHFLRQRGVDAELIVVDDSVVPCRVPDVPGIRLLRVERGMPLGEKLNAAAERARGYVFAKWDDDDYYGPGYLATMAAFLRRSKAKVVFVQPFLCYDLITGTLRVSDEHRCSGATLTMDRRTWAATPFPLVREAVDATFLLDVVAAAGPESCAGLDVGGEFIQVRHDGHLWTHMPDGQPVSDYLAGCTVSDLQLGEVVDRRTMEGWTRRREELMASSQRAGHPLCVPDQPDETGQGFSSALRLRAINAYAYPVTPHLPGSHGTAGDEFATNVDLPRVLRECTLVQEKLDGLNLGVRMRAGRLEPVLKDRSPDRAEGEALAPVLRALSDPFRGLGAGVGLRVFGELLNPSQPDIRNWRIFDVFDECAGKFWAYRRVAEAAASLMVETVPVLRWGQLRSAAQLRELLQADGADREGVVLRIEAGDWLRERYKFVIAGFRKSPWSLL